MKIAVIGCGGREHALIQKLKQSPKCSEVVAIPGNGGIAADALCIPMDITDIHSVVAYCQQAGVDYVVVAPDDPLANGMVDALAAAGIPAFGPTAAAARLEASKVFAKGLMQRYGIPTAAYQSFTCPQQALAYIQAQNQWPVVIKADGLALGKGVVICQTQPEAEAALAAMLVEKRFGNSGSTVVVEEFLTGPEVSVLAFCDGKTLVPMVSSMDHKRAGEGDTGPNTGGMGAVAPNPAYTPQVAARCMEEIYLPTVRAMAAEGAPFTGCLYFGLMLTPGGPKVIEYNCRFGDPETQTILPLLQSDLLEIMLACTGGTLASDMVVFNGGASACVVLASGGYPGKYQTGFPLAGLVEAAQHSHVTLCHAGTAQMAGSLVTAGGRVLDVVATAPSLESALEKAYTAIEDITFTGRYCRRDIGKTALQITR